MITGVTGPVMVFDEALYKFTKNAQVDFLAVRVWVAIWGAIIAITVAAFQVSWFLITEPAVFYFTITLACIVGSRGASQLGGIF